MKKQRFHRILAVAILDTLGWHKLTFPNVKRYLTSDLLTRYRICRSTNILDQDLVIALKIARNAIKNKPTPFRYAPPGSVYGEKRRAYILDSPMIDLM